MRDMPEQPSNVSWRPSQPIESPDLRAKVLARLERRRTALATQTPLDALRNEQWEVRAAAARTLGEMSAGDTSADAYEALVAALADEHRLVRGAAIQALTHVAGALANAPTSMRDYRADAVAHLAASLHDADWETRELAALALATAMENGLLSDEEAQPLLASAASDVASSVREAAPIPTPVATGEGRMLASSRLTGEGSQRSLVVSGLLSAYVQAFVRQARIIRREVWLVMVCGALAAVALACAIHLRGGTYDYAVALAFTLAGASAISMAFLAQTENDSALELTMATPVSLRFLLASRIALALGYNCALALCASALIGWMSSEPLLTIAQGWVGPLLLLSALTLALSLLAGTTVAFGAALLLDATQIMRTLTEPLRGALNAGPAFDTLRLAAIHLWGANPLTLGVIALCVAVLALLTPQRLPVEQKEA